MDEEHCEEFKVLIWPPNSQDPKSNLTFVGCAGPTSSIHGVSTSQPTGFEGSTANNLVPETTGHLQGSCRVHASVGQWINSTLCSS